MSQVSSADSGSGTITYLQANWTGNVLFKLSSSSSFVYTIVVPSGEEGWYSDDNGYHALVARVHAAFVAGEDITVNYGDCLEGYADCVQSIL